jgi:hypothetical protein
VTTIERDLCDIYQLLCRALANSEVAEPGEPGWPREAQERERIHTEMRRIFDRYPGLLYQTVPITEPANPIAADWQAWTPEQRLAFLAQLECCRWCGDLDPRCHCNNDE